jgi:hypothetical protein
MIPRRKRTAVRSELGWKSLVSRAQNAENATSGVTFGLSARFVDLGFAEKSLARY